MPPIRFRIRTIMILIAALALVMGALNALRLPFFDNMIAFTAALIFLVSAAVAILVLVVFFVVRVVVDLFACAVYFWRGRTRWWQFSRRVHRPFRRRETDRRGEFESV
jgi:phosphatidylglycerophosphate synthase